VESLERHSAHGGVSLTYLNNRYHDPTLGAFIGVDPLGLMTGGAYAAAR